MSSQLVQRPAVLIVDDNPLIVNVLQSLLESEEYRVCVSGNGQEAVEVLDSTQIDVIICDVMMPGMDGYEFHDLVRRRPEFSHIPFIFLTALDDTAAVNRGLASGADEYMTKPFDPAQVLAVVKGKARRSAELKQTAEDRFNSYRKKVVHTLSHEFRTPLVAVNTGAELLMEQSDKLDAKRKKDLLAAICRGGQRLERLVNDFMLLQQIQAGVALRLFETRAVRMPVGSLSKHLVQGMLDEVKEQGGTLSYVDRSDGAQALIYEPQIQDALRRLVQNSLKFKGEDGLIEIEVYCKAARTMVEVRDRGVGIDPERVKDALELFSQLDRDRYEQQGSGMGLAIANYFITIHSGILALNRREGGGTQVIISLPLAV